MCPRCRKILLREQNIPFLCPSWVRQAHTGAKMCPWCQNNLLREQNIPFLCPVWVRQAHWSAKMCPRCQNNLLREQNRGTAIKKKAGITPTLIIFPPGKHKHLPPASYLNDAPCLSWNALRSFAITASTALSFKVFSRSWRTKLIAYCFLP